MSDFDVVAFDRPSSFILDYAQTVCRLHKIYEAPDPASALLAIKDKVRGILSYTLSRPLNEALLGQFKNLEIIAHHGVGYDGIDANWCAKHHIVVTHTPDVLNEEVADLALGLLISTVRQLPQADAYLRKGEWTKKSFHLTASLQGRKLGILGLGRIGKAIAKRAEAFGLTIFYHNRRPVPEVSYNYCTSLAELAFACDILLLIAPGTAETRHIINADILKALGPEGILINVARGSLVDEKALIDALRQKTILSAGLDVYENEPAPNPDLIALPNTVLLPHVGSASIRTREAMGRLVVDNLKSFIAGNGPLTPVPETRW
jgi:lactate dehydrogenase-like 2-hydroxyacid dehydrogenase